MKNSLSILLILISLFALASCEKTSSSTGGVPGSQGNTPGGGNAGTVVPQPSGDFKAVPGQTSLIQFSRLVVDFEPVISGDTVDAVYPFKNTSQQTVKITQAVTSCNCILTKFPQGNLQPGATGEVEVRFITSGPRSRHEKIIAVVLEGVEESITLRLNGQVNEKI